MSDLAVGFCAWLSFYAGRKYKRMHDCAVRRLANYSSKYPKKCGEIMTALAAQYRIRRTLIWGTRAALVIGVAKQVHRHGWERLAEMFAGAAVGWLLTEIAYQLHRLDDSARPGDHPAF